MVELNEAYRAHLTQIAEAMQASEAYSIFMDTEEAEDYKVLQEQFEPAVYQLYEAVAEAEPLQLQSFEEYLLNDDFCGIFLPKALGFTVMRGQIDDRYRYVKSQEHLGAILKFICSSPNFDMLKARIGQSVQVGFALSSDIWTTGLIQSVTNKRVRWWLQSQKLYEYRDDKLRKSAYIRYKRQFKDYNYHSSEFPDNAGELKLTFDGLRDFLIYRIDNCANNNSLYNPLTVMLQNEKLNKTPEYTYVLGLFLNYFDLPDAYKAVFLPLLNGLRKENPDFSEQYFAFLVDLHHRKSPMLDAEADRRFASLLDNEMQGRILSLYGALEAVHSKGYVNDEVMAAVKQYHDSNDGLSDENEAMRQSILVYIRQLMENLEVEDYPTWLEMHKVFASYVNIFSNEAFNQSIKELYLKYIKKLLKRYTDKRGGDYQGIKKFTIRTFQELKFMNEKDVKDIFKTKRNRKPVAK